MTAEEKSKVLGVIAVVTILAIYGGYEWHSTYEDRKGYLEQSNKIANIEDAKSKSIAGSRKIIVEKSKVQHLKLMHHLVEILIQSI